MLAANQMTSRGASALPRRTADGHQQVPSTGCYLGHRGQADRAAWHLPIISCWLLTTPSPVGWIETALRSGHGNHDNRRISPRPRHWRITVIRTKVDIDGRLSLHSAVTKGIPRAGFIGGCFRRNQIRSSVHPRHSKPNGTRPQSQLTCLARRAPDSAGLLGAGADRGNCASGRPHPSTNRRRRRQDFARASVRRSCGVRRGTRVPAQCKAR
jgi:hypothetical protein